VKSLAVVIGLAALGVGAGQPPRAGRPMGPRRLMMIANYNNDIAAYWEFSGYG